MERMKKKVWRRRLAAWLIVSLCVGVCPAPVAATAAETETVAQEETKDIKQSPEEVETGEDTAWEDEEVVVEVDENGKDEWGNEYGIATEGVDAGKMSLLQVGDKLPQNEMGELVLRVADKVVKNGEEYEVTVIRSYMSKKKKMHIYLGKKLDTVSFIYSYSGGNSKMYSVHSENLYYTSEKGSLYTKDKTKLCYFYAGYYEENSVFQLPEAITQLGDFCFYGAKIKEVVLNDKIETIPYACFEYSMIERVDLKEVTRLRSYAFDNCKYLDEVKMNKEGLRVDKAVFKKTDNLKNLYFPPKTQVTDEAYIENKNREILMFGEGCYFSQKNSLGGLNLKVIILPPDTTSIGKNFNITPAPLLRRLYVPNTVESISKGALNAKGYLTLYGEKEGPAANYEDNNVTFCDVKDHDHVMDNVTFYGYDTWSVEGKYCKKCGRAEEIKVVEFTEDENKENRPELLTYPEDKCPESLMLDDSNTDDQGLIYTLDETCHEAMVKDINTKYPSLKKIFLIPENVEKGGEKYKVTTLLYGAMSGAPIVILPDTVTYIAHGNFDLDVVFHVTLGRGVKVIEEDAFYASTPTISIRGDNPYYKMVNGVLYDTQMKNLIKSVPDVKKREYVVPKSVRFIRKSAFWGDYYLKRITIYSRKFMNINENAFTNCQAEVIEQQPQLTIPEEIIVDDYGWEGEEKTVELNEEYEDSEGFYYKLNQENNTAAIQSIDVAQWDEGQEEIDKRIPDKVTYEGRVYTVTQVWMETKNRLDPHSNDVKNRRNQSVNLYIGKYVEMMQIKQFNMKIASYVHVLNSNFVSVKGSLFNKDQTKLYRFCDREYAGTEYHLPQELQEMEERAFYQTSLRTVVFNNRIKSVPAEAFECSNIEKVDLANVSSVCMGAFEYCYFLKEVIFRRDSINIQGNAFYMTKNLRSVYIPANSEINSAAFRFSGIETVILDENVSFTASLIFDECYNLQIINLPESIKKIEQRTFTSCYNLQKLYIPESITSIHSDSFLYTDVQLYTLDESCIGELKDTISRCVSLKDHEHRMKTVTFFSFDTWGVTGKYCETCGRIEGIEKREYKNKTDENLPDQLMIERRKTPKIRDLSNENKDEQGVYYTLHSNTMTATVTGTDYRGVEYKNRAVLYIPETVKKGEQLYTVNTIATEGIMYSGKVVLPDTIKKLEENCIINGTTVLDLGNGIEEVDTNAFAKISSCMEVYVSADNPYFVYEEDTLMNREQTILYKHSNYGPAEYTVPATVKEISRKAFGGYMIHQINIYNGKNVEIAPNAFEERSAYINIVDELAPPTPTPIPTVTPTASPSTAPTVSPSVVPTIEPTSSPTATPTQQPSASPSVIPPTSPSVAPTPTLTPTSSPTAIPMPTPTFTPIHSPVILPTRQPSASPSVLPIPSPVISPEPVTMPTFVPDSTAVSNPSQPVQIPENISDTTKNEKPDLTIRGFRLTSRGKRVSITWNRCTNAEFYRIYRAEKNGKYQLVQVLTSIKTSYVDKNVKPAKRYFYKIRAVGNENGVLQEGAEKRLSITLSGLEKPVIKVKKGKTDLVRYISVILKKYGGTHAQVYMSLNGKKYMKLKMTSGKIAKFRGTFRFQCKLRRKVLWLKVRTYKRNKKGRTYSGFSKAAKIRV